MIYEVGVPIRDLLNHFVNMNMNNSSSLTSKPDHGFCGKRASSMIITSGDSKLAIRSGGRSRVTQISRVVSLLSSPP